MLKKLSIGMPEASFVKKFLRLIVPIVLSEMLMVAVGFIDNFMVGNYGDHTTSLASVAIGNELMFIGFGIPMYFMTTYTIFLSQFMGSKNEEKMRQTIKFWMTTAIVVSITFAIVVASAANPLVRIFNNQDTEIINGATTYVRTAVPAVVLMCVGFITMTSASITGRPKWTLLLAVGSIAINIVGDYLLIYVADLGLMGSAIATDIARVYEVSLAIFVLSKYKNINIFHGFFHYDWALFKKESKKMTTAISQLAFTLSLVGISVVISNGYDKNAQAALATGYALAAVMWSVFPGISASVKIFIGSELGKSNFEQAKLNVRKVAWSLPFIFLPLMSLGIIFALTMPRLVGTVGVQTTMARNMVLIYSGSVPLYTYFSMNFGVMQAGGHVRASNIFQNYFQLFFIIPVAILSIWLFDVSFTQLMLITQALQVIPLLISIVLVKREKWTNNLTKEHA